MFSEKYGYKPEKAIQFENISGTLRNRIWNLFYQSEIIKGGLSSPRMAMAIKGEPTIENIIADRLGFAVSRSNDHTTPQQKIEVFLLSNAKWYEVYDFIEIHLACLEEEMRIERTNQYNELLESEKSGYRIVLGEITPITNHQEIQEIEQAARTPYDSVNQHIQKALSHYADIQNPDYENSIKESISAVEAICCIITGLSGTNATLGKTLKKLKDHGVHIHPAMESAFSSLYGYTSDENGIRHGGIDFTNAPTEDAKYMLVSCSAFVNYLIEKWTKVKGESRRNNEK